MSAARSTSPHASPTLDLDTQGENLPRTFIGGLLLSGWPADEPEDAEKVYPYEPLRTRGRWCGSNLPIPSLI
jgi:hypothetical protein